LNFRLSPYIIYLIVAKVLAGITASTQSCNGTLICDIALYFTVAFYSTERSKSYLMNISSLGASGIGITLSDTGSMNAIDTSILKKSLDSTEQTGAMITRMMEQSVNPNIGANIDVRI
jgi:hypothetical protein